MNCSKCDQKLQNDQKVCHSCGLQVDYINMNQQTGDKIMEKLGVIMTTYNETVDIISNRKTYQTFDYDSIINEFDGAINEIDVLEKIIKKNEIEINNLSPLIAALKNAMLAYRPIIIGLSNKASRKAKYGWLKRHKDLNKYDEARKILARRAEAFEADIDTTPSEPRFIKVQAYVLDPMSDDVLEEEFEILDTQYNESEKDKKGNIFVMRSYKDGESSEVISSKEVWEAARVGLHGGTQQEQEKAERIFREIDKKSKVDYLLLLP